MKWKILNISLIAAAFASSFLFYNRLPEKIPMHWNIQGEVDRYDNKQTAVWMIPGMLLLMWGLFQVLPKFDPKREKYKLFWPEWQMLQTLIIGFLAYLHFTVLYISIYPGTEMVRLIFGGMGVMFLLMGNFLPKIRQNFFVGIKVPWTLTDEENWNKTHRFGGWCFVAAGGLFLVQSLVGVKIPELTFGVTILAAFLPIGYSYLLFARKKRAE